MKIIVNKALCVGAGRCAELASGTFRISDLDGLVIVQRPETAMDEEWVVEAAVDACPSGAIRLEKDE